MLKLVSHHLVDTRNGWKSGNLGAINEGVWGAEIFFEFFCKECVQTTSLGPRIMMKLVSHHLVDTVTVAKGGIWVQLMLEFEVSKLFRVFAVTVAKGGIWVQLMQEFVVPELFRVFSQQTRPNH
jgi:hypothetical protein